jgi:hypothetical protein
VHPRRVFQMGRESVREITYFKSVHTIVNAARKVRG